MGNKAQQMQKDIDGLPVTITSGTNTSSAAILGGCTAAQIQTPAALTTTSFTFLASIDGGATYAQLRNADGSAVSITVTISGIYTLDKNVFAGVDAIKLVAVSGNEGADRIIIVKPFLV